MGAFHAYDIRGIYGKDWDRETAYKVGYFIPRLLKADKVLVGRDCRVSSPEIHDAVIQGINDAGADVYDIGLSSTPMVYFGTANYGSPVLRCSTARASSSVLPSTATGTASPQTFSSTHSWPVVSVSISDTCST